MNRFKTVLPAWLCVLALLFGCAGCTKQMRKRRYLARAEQDFRAERYDRAEVEYAAALAIPPLDPKVAARLGVVYFTEGKLQQAYALLRRAADLLPDDVELADRLAQTCLGLKRVAEAREHALRILARNPQDPQALLLLAESSVNAGQAEEVSRRLDALPAAAQNTAAGHLARATVQVLRQNMDQAEAELKAAIVCDPKSSKSYLVLGNLYLIRKDPKQAEQAFKTAAGLAPLRSAERLCYADWLFRNGSVDAARAAVEEITQKTPDYVPAWTVLARMAFSQRRFDQCHELLNIVLGRDPVNLEALLLKGNVLLTSGDSTNAIAHFERVRQWFPDAAAVEYGLAVAQLQYGEAGKALASVNQALTREPNYADALLLQADLYLRKGDTAAAISGLNRAIQQQPQLAQAYLLLGSAYLARKNPEEALAVYRRMAERFPQSPEVPLLSGLVLAQQSRLKEARQLFEAALQLSPSYLAAVERLVDLDLMDRQYAAATQRVQAQIEKLPTAAEPWLLMAKIHVARAQKPIPSDAPRNAGPASANLEIADTPEAKAETVQAEAALRKAIELNPGLRTAYLLLAQLYIATHEQQQALAQLQGFVTKTNDVVTLMQMGMIYDELKDYSAARETYEKLLKLNPRFSLALNNLAYLYSERFEQLDKAYAMAAKARELLPYDPATADTLGWILYKRREYHRSLGLIQESAVKLPAEPEIQFHLGMTYYMLNDEPGARTALARAVQSDRPFPGKPQAIQRLALLSIQTDTAGPAQLAQLEQALRADPEDPVALERIGAIQARQGNYRQAAGTFQTALQRHSQNPELMLKLAQIWFEHLGDYARALELAKQAHALAPDDARISRLLGRASARAGDYRWAASLLEEADRKLPADLAASYDLAWCLYGLGRETDAEAKLRSMLQSGATGSLRTAADQFLSLLAMSRTPMITQAGADQAMGILKQDPACLPALIVSARWSETQRDFRRAEQIYGDILARHPSFAPATRGLALRYTESPSDTGKAYSLVLKARESYPQDPALARALGILCYRRGDYRRTVELLARDVRDPAADAQWSYYLGLAHYRLKEYRESRAALQRALDLKLDTSLAAEATRLLQTAELR